MAKQMDWLGLARTVVRIRPKASIALALELGMLAAQILTKGRRVRGLSSISTLVELVPTLADIGETLPQRRRATALPSKRPGKIRPKRRRV